MKRRDFITTTAVGSLGIISSKASSNTKPIEQKDFILKNNINHSVCHWCFGGIPLEDFLKTLNELGVKLSI
jgi:hydroxypyruvate isomerase